MQTHNNTGLFRKGLTLSETTNFSLPSSKSLQITISNFIEMVVSSPKRSKTLWHKGKLLIMNNFSFCHSVLNRFLLQIRENKALFRKGLATTLHPFSQKKAYTFIKPFPNKLCVKKGLQFKSFEKLGKREIARNERFLFFPQYFLPFLQTFCHFHQI